MKMQSYLALGLGVFLLDCSIASEPGFVRTYQPLGGLANGTIHVESVMCVSRQAYNDDDHTLPISYISAPYTPPGNADLQNVNIASDAGLHFRVSYDDPKAPKIILEVESLPDDDKSVGKFNNTRETVFTAALECLRLCTSAKLKDAPVLLVTKSKERTWLEQIIQKYNKHKKEVPFYAIPKSEQVVAPNGP
jgi:hypothetical protein